MEPATDALIELAERAAVNGLSAEPLWRAFAAYNRNALTGTRCGAYPAEALAKKLQAIQSELQPMTLLPPKPPKHSPALSKFDPRRIDDAKPPFQSFYADKNSSWYALEIEYQNLRFGPIETRRQFVGKARPDGLNSLIPL